MLEVTYVANSIPMDEFLSRGFVFVLFLFGNIFGLEVNIEWSVEDGTFS